MYLIRKLYFTVGTVGKYIKYNENSQGGVFKVQRKNLLVRADVKGEEQVCEMHALAKLKL